MRKNIMAILMASIMLFTILGSISVTAGHFLVTEWEEMIVEENDPEPDPLMMQYRIISQDINGSFVKTRVRFEILDIDRNTNVDWDFGDGNTRHGYRVEYHTYYTDIYDDGVKHVTAYVGNPYNQYVSCVVYL